jgi:hypothetical protein
MPGLTPRYEGKHHQRNNLDNNKNENQLHPHAEPQPPEKTLKGKLKEAYDFFHLPKPIQSRIMTLPPCAKPVNPQGLLDGNSEFERLSPPGLLYGQTRTTDITEQEATDDTEQETTDGTDKRGGIFSAPYIFFPRPCRFVRPVRAVSGSGLLPYGTGPPLQSKPKTRSAIVHREKLW